MRKEIPILFSTQMVQAILAGCKTQTRRTTGLSKVNEYPGEWHYRKYGGMAIGPHTGWKHQFYDDSGRGYYDGIKCPYGSPGDILWVKETFTILEPEHCEGMMDRFCYKASFHESNDEWRKECIADGYSYQWTPSLFMRKLYSRIWLEVTDIRVERLHHLSEADARAEGVANGNIYRSLWQQLNGNWDENPWVWVVSFKVLSTTGKP
jgi:hypothetical protein